MTQQKVKRSKILLIAAIIATICFLYVVSYMSGTAQKVTDSSSAEAVGTSIAMAMATPSVICSGIGTLFAWLGFFAKKRDSLSRPAFCSLLQWC